MEPLESVQSWNGTKIAACIVKHDFDVICPKKGQTARPKKSQKRPKTDPNPADSVLYNPFNDSVDIATRYIEASPKCVELFDVLTSDNNAAKSQALALLSFILKKCPKGDTRALVAERFSNQLAPVLPKLVATGNTAVYYLLDVFIGIVKILPWHRVKYLINSLDLFKLFPRLKPSSSECTHFTVAEFLNQLVADGVLFETELLRYSHDEKADESIDLHQCNAKKYFCLVLLLGLKGFNIFASTKNVRLIFEQIKKDGIKEAMCGIHLLLQAMKVIFNKSYNRLSLDLPGSKYSDLPDFAVTGIATIIAQSIKKVSEDVTIESQTLIRLNKLLLELCRDFVTVVEEYGDVGTVAGVLVRLNISYLPVMNIVADILQNKLALGMKYVSQVKAKYTSELDYSVLVAFLTSWFKSAQTTSVTVQAYLQCLPSFFTRSFVNYGLLCGEPVVIQATFRLISEYVRFCKHCNLPLDDKKSVVYTKTFEILPEIRTLINAKPSDKPKATEEDVTVNVKTTKRPLISLELNQLIDLQSLHVVLGIAKDDDIFVDWLECINTLLSFVGISDVKNLYDPTKLLKNQSFADNVANATLLLKRDPTAKHLNAVKVIKLDMALFKCLYLLGFKTFEDTLSFGNVQNTVFQHLLSRFVDLQSLGGEKTPIEKQFHTTCLECIKDVLVVTKLFPEALEPLLLVVVNSHHRDIFAFLFSICIDKALELVLGVLANVDSKNLADYQCTNCTINERFNGPLFTKCALDFLVHSKSDCTQNLQCTKCKRPALNLFKLALDRIKDLDIDSAKDWIVSACSLQKNEQISKLLVALQLTDKDAVVESDATTATSVGASATANIQDDKINETSGPVQPLKHPALTLYAQLLDAIEKAVPCHAVMVDEAKALCDVAALKLANCNDAETSKALEKRQYFPCVAQYRAWGLECCFTTLYIQCSNLLDTYWGQSVTLDLPSLKDLNTNLPPTNVLQQWLHLLKRVAPRHPADQLWQNHNVADILQAYKGGFQGAQLLALDVGIACDFERFNVAEEKQALDQLADISTILESLQHCQGCNNVLECSTFLATNLFNVACHLVSKTTSADTCANLLQSQFLTAWAQAAFGGECFYIGSCLETRLEAAVVNFILQLLQGLVGKEGVVIKIRKKRIYSLIQTLSWRHTCSTSRVDILISKAITGLVELVCGLLKGDMEPMYRLPKFREFTCVVDFEYPTGIACTQNSKHAWAISTCSVPFILQDSNWLVLNPKRASLTLANFSQQQQQENTRGLDIEESLAWIASLYPPRLKRTRGKDYDDVLVELTTSLQHALECSNNVIESTVLNEPYVYNVNYLVPFIAGRLSMLLHDQVLKSSRLCGPQVLSNFALQQTPTAFQFTTVPTQVHVQEAATRLNIQYKLVDSSVAFAEEYTEQVPAMIATNGTLQLCILGLLFATTRDASLKALGIILRIYENAYDSNLVLNFEKEAKTREKLSFRALPKVHHVLYFIQRTLLHANSHSKVANSQIAFAACALPILVQGNTRKGNEAADEEDDDANLRYNSNSLARGINKVLGRLRVNVDSVTLFYECVNPMDAATLATEMSFALQVVQTGLFPESFRQFEKAHVFKVLMARGITASYQDKAYILYIISLAVEHTKYSKVLVSLQLYKWLAAIVDATHGAKTHEEVVWSIHLLILGIRTWSKLVLRFRPSHNTGSHVLLNQSLPMLQTYTSFKKANEHISKVLSHKQNSSHTWHFKMFNEALEHLKRQLDGCNVKI